jgi:hypothetical protein
MARLRATASAARSVLDGREHDGRLDRVGGLTPHTPDQKSGHPVLGAIIEPTLQVLEATRAQLLVYDKAVIQRARSDDTAAS